jgi:hypothetical protein
MSAFLYVDQQRGTSFVLSKAILKKEIFLLQGAVNVNAASLNLDSENLELRKFFAKLNFAPRVVTSVNISRIFKNETNTEILTSLFSLNKSHFKAIIYLFYENYLNYEELKEIIKADFYTRNELLLRKFEIGEEEEVSLFSDFKDNIFGKYIKISDDNFSLASTFSYLDSSASSVTPDEYYAVKNILKTSLDFNSTVKWLYQNSIEINDDQKNKSLFSLESLDYEFFSANIFITFPLLGALLYAFLFLGGLLITIAFLIGWAYIEGLKRYRVGNSLFGATYKSYLTYLKAKSRTTTGREIKKDDLINYLLNTFYPEFVRLNSRLSDVEELPNDSLFLNQLRNSVKRASSFSISDPNLKPKFARIFDHLFYTFNNTSGYSNLNSFNFDTFNNTSTFPVQSTVDFSYINENGSNAIMTPLKNLVENVFPSINGISRNDSDYMSRLFLSRVSKNGTLRKSIFEERPSLLSEIRNAINLCPTGTINNSGDIVINKISSSSSIGISGSSRKEYAEEALKLAFKKVEEVSLTNQTIKPNVILYGSFQEAKVGLIGNNDNDVSIRKIIRDEILAQTSNPADSSSNRYNKHLVDSGNSIFRIFFADMIYEYLGFLVNTSENQFVFKPSASSNSLKAYKVLKFLKHTFKLIGRFLTLLENDLMYKEYDFMLLSIENSLSTSLILNVVNRGLRNSDVKNLFELGENYRGSLSSGGGGGTVRAR